MTEERLRLRYIEDTKSVIQIWIKFPYIICLLFDDNGIMRELIIDKTDEYI